MSYMGTEPICFVVRLKYPPKCTCIGTAIGLQASLDAALQFQKVDKYIDLGPYGSFNKGNMMNKMVWMLIPLALLACSTPARESETGFVVIERVQVPSAPSDETYRVILGASLSNLADRRAREIAKGGTGQEIIAAEQEAARVLVEQELRRQGFCSSGVDVVGRLLHFGHSPDTEIVVRCIRAKLN